MDSASCRAGARAAPALGCKELGSHPCDPTGSGCSLLRQATSATQNTARCLSSKPRPCSAPPDAAEPTDSSKSPSEIPVSTPDAAERLREAWRAYSQRRRWRTFRGLIESDYCCSSSCFSTRKPELSVLLLLLLLLLLLSPLLYAIACYCTLPPTVHGGSGPHVLSWPRCPWWSRPLQGRLCLCWR